MKNYKLFLDDVRIPKHCSTYMRERIGASISIYSEKSIMYGSDEGIPLDKKHDWICVKNYDEFVQCIQENGVPYLVSYDHDLADEHYNMEAMNDDERYNALQFKEKTGYDCAKWLLQYCQDKGLKHPQVIVHSMNPVGRENIQSLFEK